MHEREAYVKKFKAQLKIWEAELDKLKAKAEKASADARVTYKKEIEELQKQLDAGKRYLNDLKTAGGNAWKDIRQQTDKAWEAMDDAWQHARTKYGP